MLNDQQQVCFTGKYTGPEYVSVGVRKKGYFEVLYVGYYGSICL